MPEACGENMEKIFVDKHGSALFRCPHCGFTKQFPASPYRDKDSRIKIKCRCGETVPVLIEFREFFRKPVELFGQAMVLSTISGQSALHRVREKFPIKVTDLSLNGMRFSIVPDPSQEPCALAVEDVIMASFRLDNRSQDLIERKAVIRNVYASSYGVSFIRTEYDKELGFYLMR